MVVLSDLTPLVPEDRIIDFNGKQVIVKQYLKMEDKLALIGRIINASIDDNNYYNPARLHIFYVLNMINSYSDVDLDSMEILDAYDIVVSTDLWNVIESTIPEKEKKFITTNMESVIQNIYAYKNSALGIVDALSKEGEATSESLDAAKKALSDPDTLNTLKMLLSNLGQGN